MVGCGNQAAEQKAPAIDRANFDESVALADDFYQYATGGWQKAHPLKPEFSRYGTFDIMRENNEIRINDLFSEMKSKKTEKGSVEQKIADLYVMGLDSVRLNNEGVTPLKADLERIAAVQSREEIAPVIGWLHRETGNPFFSAGVSADLKNVDINVLYIGQAGLGMGNRDYYLDEENASKREGYLKWLATSFALCGVEDAEAQAEAVLALETKMAKAFRSNVELRDVAANYNPTTLEAFVARYDAIEWNDYFASLGVQPEASLIVEQPEVIDAVNTLLKSEPLETLKAYLMAGYIRSAAAFLSDDIYAAHFEFFGRQMSGQEQMRPRWKRAMSVPNSILSEAVGQMYVAKYFPESEKARVETMVANIQKAFSKHIDALDWMSADTKAKAQEKLAAFTVKIGYPNKWKDYSSLTVDPAKTYWANVVEANRWYTADSMSEVGKPVDREKWLMPPQMVNAYYMPTTNEICFPAAILQPPFYNPNADDAVNYGAIGVVIAHEMTHGFDDQGSQFDKMGNMNDWWTKEDRAAFEKKTQVLVDQFNAIEVLPGLNADGKFSLGENIADQGGLRLAFTGLKDYAWAEGRPEDIDGFTGEQRFYIGYATLWAQNITDQEKERLTKVDVHSLGINRVNATLRNIQSFYDAFGIVEGDAMFMPEAERIVIW